MNGNWIESKYNIAGIIFRGEVVSNIKVDSKWHRGPAFLRLPVEQWPIRHDYNLHDELPGKSKRIYTSTTQAKNVTSITIQIERYSNYIYFVLLLEFSAFVSKSTSFSTQLKYSAGVSSFGSCLFILGNGSPGRNIK